MLNPNEMREAAAFIEALIQHAYLCRGLPFDTAFVAKASALSIKLQTEAAALAQAEAQAAAEKKKHESETNPIEREPHA